MLSINISKYICHMFYRVKQECRNQCPEILSFTFVFVCFMVTYGFCLLYGSLYAVLSCSVVSNSLRLHGLQSARLLCPCGFSRQEYWSGLPCPPPGDLPNPGLLHCRHIHKFMDYQWSIVTHLYLQFSSVQSLILN